MVPDASSASAEGGDGSARRPKGPRSETVRSRFSADTKARVDGYAEAERMTLSAAIEELTEKGLENGTTPSEMEAILDEKLEGFLTAASELLDASARRFEEGFERISHGCGLEAKNAGKAAQASLGTLSLACWLLPLVADYLPNQVILNRLVVDRLLGIPQEADRLRVPLELTAFAKEISSEAAFKMFYSDVGGKMRRDGGTRMMPAFAAAVMAGDLERSGIMGIDEEGWRVLARGGKAPSSPRNDRARGGGEM